MEKAINFANSKSAVGTLGQRLMATGDRNGNKQRAKNQQQKTTNKYHKSFKQ
jgi:ABC-type phosphonate transport system ATPase subunit